MEKYVHLKADMEFEWCIRQVAGPVLKHGQGAVTFQPEVMDAEGRVPRFSPAAVILGDGHQLTAFIHAGRVSDTDSSAVILFRTSDGSLEQLNINMVGDNSYERMVQEIEDTLNEVLAQYEDFE